MKPHVFYVILAEGPDGVTYIVGLEMKGVGYLSCVNSSQNIVEAMWEGVSPEIKKTARIAKMVESLTKEQV